MEDILTIWWMFYPVLAVIGAGIVFFSVIDPKIKKAMIYIAVFATIVQLLQFFTVIFIL